MPLLESLTCEIMGRHPLPWRIDYDWCVEVYDRNGDLVIKLTMDSEARELIALAERLKAESDEAALEFERMIADEPAI